MKTGTYYYQTFNAKTNKFIKHARFVEILKETNKSFYITNIDIYANSLFPRFPLWARKNSVKNIKDDVEVSAVEYADVRLPYKD